MGLTVPISDIVSRSWDAVVVGAGHNGLCAAAYLARSGRSVVVFERNHRVGGACTLERPFEDQRFLISPCAYLVGLLHPLVVEELELASYGYAVDVVDPHLWCPFEDDTSLALWDDPARSASSVAQIAPGDVEGYLEYCSLFGRIRRALRSRERDCWVGDAPGREELEARLHGDPEAIWITFEASIAEVIERYMRDERLGCALHGQGIIGTYAGPHDSGTAAVHLMHSSGTIEGRPGAWGYVRGGMGQVSFALADAAVDAGATLACDVEVCELLPGVGVRLSAGELVRCRSVISNADPRRTFSMLEGELPRAAREKLASWRNESPVIKINCALDRLPRFSAKSEVDPHRSMVTITRGVDATQAACETSRQGVPAPWWCELYFQSAYDPSVAPPGKHVMSVFAQFVPYTLAERDWDARREEVADAAISEIARFAPDVSEVIIEREVLAPPDVEERTGSSGGHIFQGECLPDQMWSRRFSARTEVEGLYLCGASTHPGGSVIAVNGRNAAMAVVEDLGRDQ